jgi:hypothetical protein
MMARTEVSTVDGSLIPLVEEHEQRATYRRALELMSAGAALAGVAEIRLDEFNEGCWRAACDFPGSRGRTTIYAHEAPDSPGAYMKALAFVELEVGSLRMVLNAPGREPTPEELEVWRRGVREGVAHKHAPGLGYTHTVTILAVGETQHAGLNAILAAVELDPAGRGYYRCRKTTTAAAEAAP